MRPSTVLQQSIVQRLQADLGAAIDKQQRLYVTGDLALPRDPTLRTWLSTTEQEFPVVYVIPSSASAQEQTSRWLTRNQDMLVVVEHRAADQADLQLGLQHYEAAIIEAVLGTQPPYPAHVARYDGTDYGPLFVVQSASAEVQAYVEVRFSFQLTQEDIA